MVCSTVQWSLRALWTSGWQMTTVYPDVTTLYHNFFVHAKTHYPQVLPPNTIPSRNEEHTSLSLPGMRSSLFR